MSAIGITPEKEAAIRSLEADGSRYRSGALDADSFRATRLRLGVYALRGETERFALRVLAPLGILTPDQLEVVAELAEAFAAAPIFLAPRQQIEIHGISWEDVGSALRRLTSSGLAMADGAAGVRNVIACPYAGVSPDEAFDMTPYAAAASRRFLGRPDLPALPRPVWIAFEGCLADHVVAATHDVGCAALIEMESGSPRRGFHVYVGGHLGAEPRAGLLFEPFTPAEAILQTIEAILRVYGRMGERLRPCRPRLGRAIAETGIEAFRHEVAAERALLAGAGTDTAAAARAEEADAVSRDADRGVARAEGTVGATAAATPAEAYDCWRAVCIRPQRQAGFESVRIRTQAGALTAAQIRAVAEAARRFARHGLRLSSQQGFLLRGVPETEVPATYARLDEADLATAAGGWMVTLTCCRGTRACLGAITSSHDLVDALAPVMAEAHFQEPAIAGLRIGISGCPQDCAILRLADIGFCGVTRRIGSERAPLYRIYVGGSGGERKTRFGSLLAEVPARHAPEALRRLLALYREARGIRENWLDFIDRNGIKTLWWLLDDLVVPPAGTVIEALFKDWGSDSPYRLEARRREGDG